MTTLIWRYTINYVENSNNYSINKGLVLFLYDRTQKGQEYSDPVKLKTLSANESLWQVYNRPDGAGRYEAETGI
jgi:hypothetical protein